MFFFLGIITGILLTTIAMVVGYALRPGQGLIRLIDEKLPKTGTLLPFSEKESSQEDFLEKNKNRDIPIGEIFPL